jgi:hypothetical protein
MNSENRVEINSNKTTHLVTSALCTASQPPAGELSQENRVHRELRAESLECGEVRVIADEDEASVCAGCAGKLLNYSLVWRKMDAGKEK